jgi:hypothetical protein
MAFGLYGEVLPNQNGAPLRLVVPWKYGFKSGKSIVRIRFVEQQPRTSWQQAIPDEYGFYSNVNPTVDHPRWSQATERRIGEDGLFAKKRPTLMFNGYEAQVGSCTPAWTCGRTTDVRALQARRIFVALLGPWRGSCSARPPTGWGRTPPRRSSAPPATGRCGCCAPRWR